MANEFRDYTIDIISVYTVYTRYRFENSQKFIISILNCHVELKCEILRGENIHPSNDLTRLIKHCCLPRGTARKSVHAI